MGQRTREGVKQMALTICHLRAARWRIGRKNGRGTGSKVVAGAGGTARRRRRSGQQGSHGHSEAVVRHGCSAGRLAVAADGRRGRLREPFTSTLEGNEGNEGRETVDSLRFARETGSGVVVVMGVLEVVGRRMVSQGKRGEMLGYVLMV